MERLLEIVTHLRARLEWEAAQGGLLGVRPASAAEREAWLADQLVRDRASLEVKLATLRASPPEARSRVPTPPSSTPAIERAKPAPTPSAPQAEPAALGQLTEALASPTSPQESDGPALWKTLGSRPRARYLARAAAAEPTTEEDIMANTPQGEAMSNAEKLNWLCDYLGDCQRCGLAAGRSNVVFGVGNPEARLVFVGEAPGYHEDRTGEPFVGKAGKLLDKMIEAMGFERRDVYICNVLKCRPPNNRNPNPDEVGECSPFLLKQLEAISPDVIVTLGKPASNLLTGQDTTMGRLRGRWHDWRGIPLMATYHPAYLLRNPDGKRAAWDDLQKVMTRLDEIDAAASEGASDDPA